MGERICYFQGAGEEGRKYSEICAASDGRLYCAPHSASAVLVIDPGTGSVRCWADEVLTRLEPSVLASHAAAILQRLSDDNADVRRRTLEVFQRQEPSVLTSYVAAIL